MKVSNDYVDNMVHCQAEGCSYYFYQMGEHKVCLQCRVRGVNGN